MSIIQDKNVDDMTIEELRKELKELRMAFDIESSRTQRIADYVGAIDYVDSIGPILDAIDSLKAKPQQLSWQSSRLKIYVWADRFCPAAP